MKTGDRKTDRKKRQTGRIQWMKIYLAPLEGITGHIYRTALKECFDGFDKYFIPFISPNQKGHFSTREKKDVLPENNRGVLAVPQILTNQAEDFIETAKKLAEYGYEEVNLNLGCPSRTVVTKGRGAGFLEEPDRLDRFLDEIFKKREWKISVKTRIGMSEPEEFEDLLKIYNRYPLEELIVHPRLQKDFYKNTPNLDVFAMAAEESRNPLCYNGDICNAEDLKRLRERFPKLDCVMVGRGVLADPALGRVLKGGGQAEKAELRKFHDLLYRAYCEEMSGDRTVLYKMKELWFYFSGLFTNGKKYYKKIKKCERCIIKDGRRNSAFYPGSYPAGMDGLVLESSDSSGRRRCFLDSAGNNSSVFQKDKTCGSCRIAGTAGGGVDHECLPEKFCGKDKTL